MNLEKQPCRTVSKIIIFKNFEKFTEQHLHWNLFFNKVVGSQSTTLSERDSDTLVFLRIWNIFKDRLFIEHLPAATSL